MIRPPLQDHQQQQQRQALAQLQQGLMQFARPQAIPPPPPLPQFMPLAPQQIPLPPMPQPNPYMGECSTAEIHKVQRDLEVGAYTQLCVPTTNLDRGDVMSLITEGDAIAANFVGCDLKYVMGQAEEVVEIRARQPGFAKLFVTSARRGIFLQADIEVSMAIERPLTRRLTVVKRSDRGARSRSPFGGAREHSLKPFGASERSLSPFDAGDRAPSPPPSPESPTYSPEREVRPARKEREQEPTANEPRTPDATVYEQAVITLKEDFANLKKGDIVTCVADDETVVRATFVDGPKKMKIANEVHGQLKVEGEKPGHSMVRVFSHNAGVIFSARIETVARPRGKLMFDPEKINQGEAAGNRWKPFKKVNFVSMELTAKFANRGLLWAFDNNIDIQSTLARIANEYWPRRDGTGPLIPGGGPGSKRQLYWLAGEPGLLGEQQYVFGDFRENNTFVLKETPMEPDILETLKAMASMAIREATGLGVPRHVATWIVICKYNQGDKIAFHQDNDYNAGGFDFIVSFTARGAGTFHVKLQKEAKHHSLGLNLERTYVFSTDLFHAVDDTLEERLNITMRYTDKGMKNIFKWPRWYNPENYRRK